MALETGDDGKILIGAAALADITAWTFKTSASTVSYASSATGGFRRRVVGAKEGRGKIHFKLDLAEPISEKLEEGAEVTLLLHLDATRFYRVPAVVNSLQLDVDIEGGTLVGGVAEFQTNGPWTRPTH